MFSIQDRALHKNDCFDFDIRQHDELRHYKLKGRS